MLSNFPTIRLVQESYGNGIALGIYGPRDQITQVLDALYNHKGHSDDSNFLSDGFAFVLTTRDQLIYGLTTWALTHALYEGRELTREERAGAWERAAVEARADFDSIGLENFMGAGREIREYDLPSEQKRIN